MHFLQIFDILKHFYRSKEVIQMLTQEVIADAANDNVLYLELRFNPMALSKSQNYAFHDVVEWVMQAVKNAQKTSGIRTCLILQIPRNEPVSIAEEIADIAIAYQGVLVRGIDLAGDEKHFPPNIFIQPLKRAHSAGLNITIHAGEATGAQSIHDAITYLFAQRIGHGIRAVESQTTLNLLEKRQVTLEICPTSNIKTGLVCDYAHHPLSALHKRGLRITLNTDDPSIFSTTASQEILVAVQHIGIPPLQIYRFLRYGVEAAFIPPDERPWLLGIFHDALKHFPGALDVFNAI
jgi:adenosine deaminase